MRQQSASGPAFENLPAHTVEEGVTTYVTNELNQYPQITTPSGVIGLAYDDDGNLTNDGTFQYVYDAENRMITATPLYPVNGSKKLEAGYDYRGRRVSKTVYTYNAGTWTLESTKTATYDGWNVIQETTTGSSTSTEFYVWGLDLSGTLQGAGGIGGLLLWQKPTGTFLYLYDANGNVGQLVNAATGALAARYEYDPFGNILVADGPEAENNPFRYSTKYFDAETGLYHYIFRYYSAKLGRWMTRDPVEEEGGLNLYGFVGNNPINEIDPFGLATICDRIYECKIRCAMGWEHINEQLKILEEWQVCYDRLAPVAVLTGVEKALQELRVANVFPQQGDDLKALLPEGCKDYETIKKTPGVILEEVLTKSDKKAWRVRLHDKWELKIYLGYSGVYRAAVGFDTNNPLHYWDYAQWKARTSLGLLRGFPNPYNAEAYGHFWAIDASAMEEYGKCQ